MCVYSYKPGFARSLFLSLSLSLSLHVSLSLSLSLSLSPSLSPSPPPLSIYIHIRASFARERCTLMTCTLSDTIHRYTLYEVHVCEGQIHTTLARAHTHGMPMTLGRNHDCGRKEHIGCRVDTM